MQTTRNLILTFCVALIGGCEAEKPHYGYEQRVHLPGTKRQSWAVAPVINLSGQRQVDSLLQADILFSQLQQIQGITAIPVNRVAEAYAQMGIERVESEQQAAQLCARLGCDGLVVASVTLYDPYFPPKMGAAMQLFRGSGGFEMAKELDPHELARQSAPPPGAPLPQGGTFIQTVGMYDSANGTTLAAEQQYAAGRNDPVGPFRSKEYLVDMDRYSGFVYYSLLTDLISKPQLQR